MDEEEVIEEEQTDEDIEEEDDSQQDVIADDDGNVLVIDRDEETETDSFASTVDGGEDEYSEPDAPNPSETEEPEVINDNIATLDSLADVREGDQVAVMVVNGTPTVIGAVGGGDRTKEEISDVQDTAEAATVAAAEAAEVAAAAQQGAEEAQKGAEEAQRGADSANELANAARAAANTAQSTADTAKADAATAQSTADTAKAAADSAQATADSKADKVDDYTLSIQGTTPALEGINLTDDAEFGTKWTNAIYIEDEKCWQGGTGQLTRVRYDNLPSRICVEFDFRYTTLSAAAAANGIYVAFYYTDGTVNYGRTQRPTEWTRYSFVSTEGKVIDHIGFGYNINGTCQIRNVMIYEWTESPGGGYIENGRNSGYVKKDSLMLVRHGKNLTPYFAHTLQNPLTTDWYWYSITRDKITFADDGWLHIEADNIEATSTLYIRPYVRAQGFIKNSTVYTCLLEFRNVEYTGTIRFDPSSASAQHPQMHGGFFGYDGSSSHRWVMTSYADAETSSVTLLRFVIGISTGSYFKGDIRLSLYEGEYTGEYQPYYYDTVSIPLNGHTVAQGQSVEVSSDGVVTLHADEDVELGTVTLPKITDDDILEVVANPSTSIVKNNKKINLDQVRGETATAQSTADDAAGKADAAQATADTANATANATKAHFWADDGGAHVATVEGDVTQGFSTTIGATNSTTGIIQTYNNAPLTSFTPEALNFYHVLNNRPYLAAAFTPNVLAFFNSSLMKDVPCATFSASALNFYRFKDNGDRIPSTSFNKSGAMIYDEEGNQSAAFTKSNVSFFDGEGGEADNVVAYFGKNGARMGKGRSIHADITESGFSVNDGSDQVAFIGRGTTSGTYYERFALNSDPNYRYPLSHAGATALVDVLLVNVGDIATSEFSFKTGDGDGGWPNTVSIDENNAAGRGSNATLWDNAIPGWATQEGTNYIDITYACANMPTGRIVSKGQEVAGLYFGTNTTADASSAQLVAYDAGDGGHNVFLRAGNNMVLGSGESADNIKNQAYLDSTSNSGEKAILASDENVYLVSNADSADSTENYRQWVLASSGQLNAEPLLLDYQHTATRNGAGVQFNARDGIQQVIIGSVHGRTHTTNGTGAELFGCHKNASGQNVYNALQLFVNDDGKRTVTVTEAAPWRTALELGSLATKSSVTQTQTVVTASATNSAAIAANANVEVDVTIQAPANAKLVGVVCCSTNNANLVSRGFDVDGFGMAGSNTVKTYWRNVGSAQIAAKAATISIQATCLQAQNIS